MPPELSFNISGSFCVVELYMSVLTLGFSFS